MIKEFTVFGSNRDAINISYLIGIPSGQIIDLDKKEVPSINFLKQDGIISYNHKLNSYCFRDFDYNKILKFLNKEVVNDSLKKEIGNFFKHQKSTYLINPDGTIDVSGDVIISGGKYKKIPFEFQFVTGNFIFKNCMLETLNGCPKKIGKDFDVSENSLFNLNGGPVYVGKDYNCSDNFITTLYGSPEKIFGNFDCSSNFIPNLIGGPKIVKGYMDCSENPLEYMDGRPDCRNIIGKLKDKKILRDEGDGKMSW